MHGQRLAVRPADVAGNCLKDALAANENLAPFASEALVLDDLPLERVGLLQPLEFLLDDLPQGVVDVLAEPVDVIGGDAVARPAGVILIDVAG